MVGVDTGVDHGDRDAGTGAVRPRALRIEALLCPGQLPYHWSGRLRLVAGAAGRSGAGGRHRNGEHQRDGGHAPARNQTLHHTRSLSTRPCPHGSRLPVERSSTAVIHEPQRHRTPSVASSARTVAAGQGVAEVGRVTARLRRPSAAWTVDQAGHRYRARPARRRGTARFRPSSAGADLGQYPARRGGRSVGYRADEATLVDMMNREHVDVASVQPISAQRPRFGVTVDRDQSDQVATSSNEVLVPRRGSLSCSSRWTFSYVDPVRHRRGVPQPARVRLLPAGLVLTDSAQSLGAKVARRSRRSGATVSARRRSAAQRRGASRHPDQRGSETAS